jgi:cyclopropane fatty-acyl-phospholipid synthase-like methyltransferase
MGFFDDEKNVQEYICMAEGYDGKELIEVLKKYVQQDATVLELGMGPGKDCDILRQFYRVTGSDNSAVFLERYRKAHPDADILSLDAVHIKTQRTFDCIYSNKVLHHLTTPELRLSFHRQYDVLNEDGIMLHSFWYGQRKEEYEGLLFVYYTEADIQEMLEQHFAVLDIQRYSEMEENDSFYAVARKS